MNKSSAENHLKERDVFVTQFNSLQRKPSERGEDLLSDTVQPLDAEAIIKLPTQKNILNKAVYSIKQSQIRLEIIHKEKQYKEAKEKMKVLLKQLEKELGPEATHYKTFLHSREGRDDRIGYHEGKQYIRYIEERSLELHRYRLSLYPDQMSEYVRDWNTQ